MRSAITSGFVGLIVFFVPVTVLLTIAVKHHLDRDALYGVPPPVIAPWWVLLAALVLAIMACAVGLALANRASTRFIEPMQRLTEQAERLGAGDARYERIRSGIEEIDRVSAVLASSAQQLLTSLSSERDFASDASHQLRTPLTALLMRLEEISLTDDLDVAHEEANIAIDQVERLNATVDALLARSRTHSPAASAPTSLDAVLARLQQEWMPAFESAQRTVRVSGERGLRLITTPVALAQILSTLIENSLVHGKGLVRIDARRSGPSVVVEVSDQGLGVSPELAPHIFERSVSTKSTGLGLGLARDLAESHGGRLELVQGYPVVFALFLSAAEPTLEAGDTPRQP
ncbi:Adaptive-response sensory-kinase SasA [Austwickia sp. TVS 96-490-7B]|uniref:sensor histidine kinase n=1 Tax=Austwickia sp. TVS 96-490-7B TaxID=2830843 RepID=UPI001C55AC88|nr:HAMP domain-containing sensor histidine kinase [Austwickia sp. TVS 96-490-7B]MBW3085370.1 Adaptive-response sensory-kinase SasA [Austwickia sp. TVS 96-490-7B]